MIVADTSSLITLVTADVLPVVLAEYDVHTTETVREELDATADYDDSHCAAARAVLNQCSQLTVHETEPTEFQSSRIDEGEGSCIRLTRELDAEFLITDDLRALPELQALTTAQVAISPILLKALVQRGVLGRADALEKLDQLADARNWLGAPIYRRARDLFDTR